MTIIFDLNGQLQHQDRRSRLVMTHDTIVVIRAPQISEPVNLSAPASQPHSPMSAATRTSYSGLDDEEEPTWEDAEWQ